MIYLRNTTIQTNKTTAMNKRDVLARFVRYPLYMSKHSIKKRENLTEFNRMFSLLLFRGLRLEQSNAMLALIHFAK